MSSNEENLQCKQDLKKRRRKQKACDNCRHRKVKCDGMVMPGKRCSNCITFKLDCVYIDGTQNEYSETYVEDLERKVQEMEKLLLKMLPDGEFDSRFTRGTRPKRWAKVSDSDDDITTEIEKKYLQDPDRVCLEQMTERYKDLTPGYRFFGKSSSAQLVETAVNFKHEYSGNTREPPPFLRWKRPEFWDWKPPYHSSLRNEICDEVYTFPEDDLLRSLVDLYFERINILLPLLHRPTFENLVAEKLHLKDQKFADVVLFVCAVASRYSDDPRVLFEGQHSAQSSGWKWVHQVVSTFRISIRLPTLYDLQFLCLFSQFMLGSSAPRMCWTLAGIGLRLAQDVGVHQRRATDSPNTVEGELWKRAFWCLMFLDRVLSSHLGQSCALYEEETDVELPAECDDQYWICANPEEAFKQPAGQPSDISYFNTSLRLSNLLQNCLRTLYLMKKAKLSFGFLRQGWDLQAATKLDASLDSWFDSIPEHLRWNPNQENPIHFNQSALLHILYFHLRILIHRPFIASSNDTIPLHVHSLVICTNAARSCSFIVDAQRIRGYLYPISGFIAFNAGVILLFNIWYRKHFDHSFDASHDIDNVHKYMKMLEHLNASWSFAGSLWSILHELASMEDLSVPDSISSSADTWDGGPTDDHDFGLFTTDNFIPSFGNSTDSPLSTAWTAEGQHSQPQQPLEALLGSYTWFDGQNANGHSYSVDQSVIPPMSDLASQWMDNAMVDIWSHIPETLELDDWNTYLSNLYDPSAWSS